MAQQEIGVGAVAGDNTGDPLRTAFVKVNENFTEVYGTLGTLGSVYSGTGHNHDAAYDAIGSAAAALADALAADFSGSYGDLANIPSTFAPATHTHSWGQIAGTLTAQTDLQAALDGKQGTGAYLLGTYTSHAHATLYIGTGVPSATGYALLTAASAAAGRTAIAAGTSNFDGVYGSLSGAPTLGSVSTVNTNGTAAYFLNGTGGWSIPPGTATGGGSGPVIRYNHVTAVSTGTGTTYANVTGLSVGISPNEVMQVHAYIFGGCSGTGGSRLTVTAPSGAAGNLYIAGNGASATAYTMGTIGPGVDLGVSLWNANALGRMAEIHGVIANGTTSGTVQVQRRSVVAANQTTVSVGSHMNGMVH